MTKLKAPEGVSSAAVEDAQYEVDESGHIEVENPEHIPHLQRHGFDYADEAELTHSDPVDEPGPCPDFSKFVNRQALVDYLIAHGNREHEATEKRADLEAACVACHASGAERVYPEGDEQTVESDVDADTGEGDGGADGADADAGEGAGEGADGTEAE